VEIAMRVAKAPRGGWERHLPLKIKNHLLVTKSCKLTFVILFAIPRCTYVQNFGHIMMNDAMDVVIPLVLA
jgi:hypothetical protein